MTPRLPALPLACNGPVTDIRFMADFLNHAPRFLRPVSCARHGCSALWLLLLTATTTAFSQAPTDAPETSRIVVSATRSAQSDFQLPVSIDLITREDIQGTHAQVQLSEALGSVPGVRAQSRQNHAQDLQISSRGFGARASFGVRGIRLYSDGIPATMPDGQGQVSHFDLGSAERIEVMRGPFSVLYGNAAGGVIALTSEEGSAGTQLSTNVQSGSFGSRRLAFKASGDRGNLNYLLSASRFDSDGYRTHSRARRDTLNAKLRLVTGADSTLTLVGNSLDMPDSHDPQGLTEAQWRANPKQAAPSALTYNTRKSNTQQQLGLNWQYALSTQHQLQVTTWGGQRTVRQYQSIPVGPQNNAGHPGGIIDLDRDYSGIDGRWTWKLATLETTLGVSFEQQSERRRGYENFIGTTLGVRGALRRDEINRIQSRDTYLQTVWTPTANWQMLAGVRRSEVRVNSRDHYIVGTNRDDSGRTQYTATTPAWGVSYALMPHLRAYLAWGQGFESPTSNELAYRPDGNAGMNLALGSAQSRHREAGLKAQWGRHGHLTLARFAVDTADEIGAFGNVGGRATFQNVGKTERRGWEVSYSDRYAGGLFAQWAWTLLDARYRDTTGTATAGNVLPGTAHSALVGELAWVPAERWRLTLEGRREAKLWANDANTAAAPAYAIANLSLRYTHKIGELTLQPFVRIDNLTDTRYVGSVIVNESNARYFEPAPGRNHLIGANLRWEL